MPVTLDLSAVVPLFSLISDSVRSLLGAPGFFSMLAAFFVPLLGSKITFDNGLDTQNTFLPLLDRF